MFTPQVLLSPRPLPALAITFVMRPTACETRVPLILLQTTPLIGWRETPEEGESRNATERAIKKSDAIVLSAELRLQSCRKKLKGKVRSTGPSGMGLTARARK